VAVLLGVVVVALLGLAAPAFAGGSTDEQGQEHGRDDRPPELVDDVRENLDRALPGREDDGPAAPAEQPAASLGGAEAPAARTAAPATGPAVTEVAEVPSALAAPVVDLPVVDLPAVAPSAAARAAALPSAAAPAFPVTRPCARRAAGGGAATGAACGCDRTIRWSRVRAGRAVLATCVGARRGSTAADR
jgi:hypothetical protein